jgi:hypothetical protein
MSELKMPRMKSDTSNSPLQRLRRMVFSVADDGMADRRKLHSNLILQSRHQRNSDERCGAKTAFDEIAKFSTSRLGAAPGGQPLKHSFSPKVVNERPLFVAEMSANHCEILPHRTMAEKLLDEFIPIPFGFRKEQNPGRKTIDAMYDECPLSPRFQFCRKQRPCGWGLRAFDGHRRKSGGFIEGHDGVVFVEPDKLAWETTISPILHC